MDGSKLIIQNKKILNYNEIVSFVENMNTTIDQLNTLALDIEDNIFGLDVHNLLLAKTLLLNIKKRVYSLSDSPINDLESSGASREKGIAKVLHAPGAPKRRQNPPGTSILNFPNGSVLAVGLMMLNVVIVGIMYIIMAIAKIGG